MEKKYEQLEKFLAESGTRNEHITQSFWRFQGKLASTARVQSCTVELQPAGNDKLHIRVILPFRAMKAERSAVSRELAEINARETDGFGFIMDPIDGSVYFKAVIAWPESKDKLDKYIEGILEFLSHASDVILMAILEAKQAIEDAKIKKAVEERMAAEDAMKQAVAKRPPNLFDRLLSLVGFVDREAVDDLDDFDDAED